MSTLATVAQPLPHAHAGPALAIRNSFAAIGTHIWRALQRLGQRRAAAQLLQLARQHAAANPARANELRAAAIACLPQRG